MPAELSSQDLNRRRTAKMLMLCRNQTVSGLAKKIGVTPATVSMVISGRTTSKRVQNRLSQLLGVERASLWPK
jgi:predicted transcriptional regulator